MQGKIRIIGGKWRGRKLFVPAVDGLRPTPDRVRETLFNWLVPILPNAYCLDMFAGSGALSFEALSRGTQHAVMLDHNPKILAHLHQQAQLLKVTEQVTILPADIPQSMPVFTCPFNLVFLDPPFQKGLIIPCLTWLMEQNLLAADAWIYIETEASLNPLILPSGWQIIKQKKAGQVRYYLAKLHA